VKQIKNFAILAVMVVLAAVGFAMFSQSATGTTQQIFDLGKGVTRLMAALFLPFGLYIVAKMLT
jgi:hypothetical protein